MPAILQSRKLPDSLQTLYQRHTDFILLLILFVAFRVLALVAYRPGGLVLDFSDFYWYRSFAELTRQGYYPYHTLWTTYPPLFPLVMIAIYQISALLPPWNYANLWFTLLLGGFFLLFELGNFILLYLFALKLYAVNPDSGVEDSTGDVKPSPVITLTPKAARQNAIRACWIYAVLFVPVYTLTGWFESYPLFFFLLSLYLLLQNRPDERNTKERRSNSRPLFHAPRILHHSVRPSPYRPLLRHLSGHGARHRHPFLPDES
jgi:hypothetical protein